MAKEMKNHVALEDFEIKAQEFISLVFDLSEQELSKIRKQHGITTLPHN
jgi:hypothetical protein